MKKVLITGVGGFIGSNLLRKIKSSNKYNDYDWTLLSSNQVEGFNTLLVDNYKNPSFKGLKDQSLSFDICLHLGGYIPKTMSEGNSINGALSNVYFTHFLIENISLIEKIIFASTVDVYEITTGHIDENSTVNPVSLYGHSKWFIENMLKSWGHQQNVNVVNLRIGHIFGPGEEKYKKLIPFVIQQALNNEQISMIGNGQELRSFLFIDDCVDAILNTIEKESLSEVINITSDEEVKVKDIIHQIIEITGYKLELEIKENKGIARNLVFNNSRMRRELLVPKISFTEGLKKEIEYFKLRKQ